MSEPLRIATRGSKLALWQANHIADRLRALPPQSPKEEPLTVELVVVKTSGDQDQTSTLQSFGGTGAFTREVQHSVLNGDADFAVHSLKDLPTELHPELTLGAIPQRESLFDALVLPKGSDIPFATDDPWRIDDPWSVLKDGAKLGTGSVRRSAQALRSRPDLIVEPIRGNVETRLAKLDSGEYDATILACAGLRRLGLADRISVPLRPPFMFPAVGQGALGLECRADDDRTCEVLSRLTDPFAARATTAERSLLKALRAGCHAPVGVHYHEGAELARLEAIVLSPDGTDDVSVTYSCTPESTTPESLGILTAEALASAGGAALLGDTA